MKHLNDQEVTDSSSVVWGNEKVKTLVRIFKQAISKKISLSMYLIEEVGNRFGSLHDVVERFIKYFTDVVSVLDGSYSETSMKANDEIHHRVTDQNQRIHSKLVCIA